MSNKIHIDEDNIKQVALAKHLGIDLEEVQDSGYERFDLPIFKVGSKEYVVATDKEADEACTAYCKDTAWAFLPGFLANLTDMPEEVFEALGGQCESGNAGTIKIIEKTCGIDKFVKEAVLSDGRGHFLSPYDGEEQYVDVTTEDAIPEDIARGADSDFFQATAGEKSVQFYIYRIN